MNWFKATIATIIIIGFTACRTAKDIDPNAPPMTPPVKWGMTTTSFDAGAVAFTELKTEELDRLIEAALGRNPDLGSMAARVQSAASNARVARADLFPHIGLGLVGSESKQNFIGLPIPGAGNDVLTTRFKSFGLHMNASWELDIWGRLHHGKNAAKAEYIAAENDFAYYQLSLAAQVAKAWAQALTAQSQLELSIATSNNFQTTSDRIRERFLHGLSPSLEYRLALNSSETAQALLQQRQEQKEVIVRLLQILIGQYPDGKLQTVSALPYPIEPVPAGLPSELLQRRPDLVAAQWRLKAADHRLWAARKAFFPRLSLTGSAGTSTPAMKDLLDTDFTVWNVAGNLMQPLFQGGRILAGIDFSKASVQQALADYHSSLLKAFNEVETGLQTDYWLRKRHDHLQKAAEQSRAALSLAEDRYESGLSEIFTVLESQRRHLNDSTQLIEVQRLLYANRIDLMLALGGPVQSSKDQSLAVVSDPTLNLSKN
jgi:multidrug efflux system outer membrane protein